MENELVSAVILNDIEKVKNIIKNGLEINKIINNHRLITLCAEKGYFLLLKYLIDSGADYQHDFYSLLKISTINGHIEIVIYLLKLKVNKEYLDIVLSYSWANNRINIFEYLLYKYFQKSVIHYAYKNDYFGVIDYLINEEPEEAFCTCAELGYIEIMKYFIKNGINVNCKGGKALINACYYNNFDIVKFLIENNADIRLQNSKALLAATHSGNSDIAKYLVDQGGDVNTEDGEALYNIVSNGDLDLLDYFVQKGANLHLPNLHILPSAAKYGHTNIIEYLMKNGCDLRICNDYAYMSACSEGKLDVIKFLINKGVEINTRNGEGLCFASYNGHTEVVKYLIENGIAVNVLNNMALIDSCYEGHFEVVKLLVEKGADINANNGRPLNSATCSGNIEIVKFLLKNGAKVTKEILENAIDLNFYYLTNCLIKNGGKVEEISKIYQYKYEIMKERYPVNKDIIFKNNGFCPITYDDFMPIDELLGCDKCLQVFKREPLEYWLMNNSSCPFRCEKSIFYKI